MDEGSKRRYDTRRKKECELQQKVLATAENYIKEATMDITKELEERKQVYKFLKSRDVEVVLRSFDKAVSTMIK